MHTIKGSAAMMLFNNISGLAHSLEDVFFYLREHNPQNINYNVLSDMILRGIDFIKVEIQKIKNENNCDGDASQLIEEIKGFLSELKELNPPNNNIKPENESQKPQQKYYISHDKKAGVKRNIYKAVIHFEQGCEMENIRAFAIIHNLKDITDEIYYEPEDIIDNDDSVKTIREQGFKVYLRAECSFEEMNNFFQKTVFLKDLELIQLENDEELKQFSRPQSIVKEELPVKIPGAAIDKYENEQGVKEIQASAVQSIISVQVNKLDKLLDLVGELVVTEAMVTENPIILSLEEQELHKATGQLKKITSELQRIVMSMRMVPLSATFHKMLRVVRDMSKKLGKEVELEIIGEETEVDKNIIEHISDPLMHLVRNAVDHGIESPEERLAKGKNKTGKVTLEAKHIGGNVQIIRRYC
jgi:two-component system chemotaxis sensor kinase CheA